MSCMMVGSCSSPLYSWYTMSSLAASACAFDSAVAHKACIHVVTSTPIHRRCRASQSIKVHEVQGMQLASPLQHATQKQCNKSKHAPTQPMQSPCCCELSMTLSLDVTRNYPKIPLQEVSVRGIFGLGSTAVLASVFHVRKARNRQKVLFYLNHKTLIYSFARACAVTSHRARPRSPRRECSHTTFAAGSACCSSCMSLSAAAMFWSISAVTSSAGIRSSCGL